MCAVFYLLLWIKLLFYDDDFYVSAAAAVLRLLVMTINIQPSLPLGLIRVTRQPERCTDILFAVC